MEPDYSLRQMHEVDWQFVLSSEMEEATIEFDGILESSTDQRQLTAALRKFLKRYPNHIDALHHFGACKMAEGKLLDGYAFAQTAVAIGQGVFPDGFRLKNDCLPGGWITNRPFLRALYGLMMAQYALGQVSSAIDTGYSLLGCESHDRMGARLLLPIYLLEENRNNEASELFVRSEFKETFGPAEYLHALALIRLDRVDAAATVLEPCFRYYPKVADYLLNPDLPIPENDSFFGGVSWTSDYGAWSAAEDQRELWIRSEGALDELAAQRKKHTKS